MKPLDEETKKLLEEKLEFVADLHKSLKNERVNGKDFIGDFYIEKVDEAVSQINPNHRLLSIATFVKSIDLYSPSKDKDIKNFPYHIFIEVTSYKKHGCGDGIGSEPPPIFSAQIGFPEDLGTIDISIDDLKVYKKQIKKKLSLQSFDQIT